MRRERGIKRWEFIASIIFAAIALFFLIAIFLTFMNKFIFKVE